MFASGLFRSRAAAVTAGATVALLIGLEGADALASGRTDDDVQDASTIALFGAAMATAVTASSISLVWRRPVPRRNVPWSIGIFLIWLGASVNRVAKHQLGSAYRSKLTVVSGQQVVTSGLYRFVRHPMRRRLGRRGVPGIGHVGIAGRRPHPQDHDRGGHAPARDG